MDEDRILIEQILSGDKVAFKKLINKNERLVFHMVSRLVSDRKDIEDLCQETFLKVYQKLGDFSFKSKLSTWIATIAYNKAINYLRKRKAEVNWSDDEEGLMIDIGTPFAILENKELRNVVRKCVEQLPKQYRLMISMYHLDELSYSEISEITKIPEGTVKSYLFRGRRVLKEKLKGYYQMEPSK